MRDIRTPQNPLFLLITLLLLSSAAYAFEGPLSTRNRFPLFVVVNPPSLEKASPEDSLSLSLSHSSVFMVKSSPQWTVGLDMEVTELDVVYRKRLLDALELGVEVPFLTLNSGFMDDALSWYHETFGLPDYGRSARPENEFLYEVKRNGKSVIRGKSGSSGVGDIRLSAKKALLSGDTSLGVKVEAEIPTGEARRGFGSGSIDGGIALMMDRKIGGGVMVYGNLGAVFPGDLRGNEKVELREFLYGGIGAEIRIREKIALLGQIALQGSPFPKTGISTIDRTSVLLTIGGRYSSGRNSFELSLTEDPNTSGAPDFTATFSFKRRFY